MILLIAYSGEHFREAIGGTQSFIKKLATQFNFFLSYAHRNMSLQ